MRVGKPIDVIEWRRSPSIEIRSGQDEARPVIALILAQKLGEMGGVRRAGTGFPVRRGLAAEMHARMVQSVCDHERLCTEHGPVEQCASTAALAWKPRPGRAPQAFL